MDARSTPPEAERSRWFWPLALSGWAVITYAIVGLVVHRGRTKPLAVARLLIGLNLAHDLVVVPVAIGVGVVGLRLVPARARATVKAALATSAVVALFAYPLVRAYGRNPAAGPSRLPNNYAHGLVVTLLVVWVGTALVGIGAALVRRLRP